MVQWRKRLDQWQERLLNLVVVKQIVHWSKTKSLPGFERVPVYYVVDFFIKETMTEHINTRANSIAFSFFIALFPFLIFLLTLLAYMPLGTVNVYLNTLHDTVSPVLPENVDAFLFDDVINGIFTLQRGDLLSIGFILAIYFASNGVMSILQGFEKSYASFTQRNLFKKRLVSLGLTIVLGILILVAMALLILSQGAFMQLLQWARLTGFEQLGLALVRWVLVLVLFHTAISLIYRYGPSLKIRSPYFSPGANLATILIIISSLGFAFFINRFGTYNKVYGSIGAILVTMLFIKINAMVLLIGYELNASIVVNKSKILRGENPLIDGK